MTTRTAVATQHPGLTLVTKAQARAVTSETMQGLDKLIAQSVKFDAKKMDYPGSASDFKFTNAGKIQRQGIVMLKGFDNAKSPAMGFTDNAMGQWLNRISETFFGAGDKTGMDRKDWATMQTRFPKHFAGIMNDLLAQYGENPKNRGLMLRSYDKQVRAVFTDLYGIVNNTDMLKCLVEILRPEVDNLPEMRMVRSSVSPDDMLVQVVWKNVKGRNEDMNRPGDGMSLGQHNTYGVGAAIRNGETGNTGIKVTPMIWRSECTNTIFVADDRAINLRHVGHHHAILAKIKMGMIDCLPLAEQALAKIYEAEYVNLPNIADVIRGFAIQNKWDDELTDKVMLGTEGKATKMGVINGITYAGHASENTNTDLQVDMSTLGGHLLNQPISVFNRAAELAKSAR